MERKSRDVVQLKKVWRDIYVHLFDHRSWDSQPSSLFTSSGSSHASSSSGGAVVQAGPRKKKFAEVRTCVEPNSIDS